MFVENDFIICTVVCYLLMWYCVARASPPCFQILLQMSSPEGGLFMFASCGKTAAVLHRWFSLIIISSSQKLSRGTCLHVYDYEEYLPVCDDVQSSRNLARCFTTFISHCSEKAYFRRLFSSLAYNGLALLALSGASVWPFDLCHILCTKRTI